MNRVRKDRLDEAIAPLFTVDVAREIFGVQGDSLWSSQFVCNCDSKLSVFNRTAWTARDGQYASLRPAFDEWLLRTVPSVLEKEGYCLCEKSHDGVQSGA